MQQHYQLAQYLMHHTSLPALNKFLIDTTINYESNS